MTEDEAKTRFCPRLFYPPQPYVQYLSTDYGGKCLGSACMAWRWEDVPGTPPHRYGFCGLAGKP